MNSDFKELLSLFRNSKVQYLVVGGYAVIKYTEPRYTKDLDLWVKADTKNALAVYSALSQFGAPLTGLTANDFASEGYFYQMGVAPVRIDILMSVSGVIFDDAWIRREVVNIDGVEINFISKKDLIDSKRAAGRPKDMLDLRALLEADE